MFTVMQDKLSFIPHFFGFCIHANIPNCTFPSFPFIYCMHCYKKARGIKSKLSDTHLDQLEGEAFMENAIDPGTAR